MKTSVLLKTLGKGVETDYVGKPVKEGDRVIFRTRNKLRGLRVPVEPLTKHPTFAVGLRIICISTIRIPVL